ncbi:Uncharacterized protein GBIM_16183 [Gryllus bimaculatus]|nr:Uncharacterized protein GBIM_16183 [Gryllus bimaculatus]
MGGWKGSVVKGAAGHGCRKVGKTVLLRSASQADEYEQVTVDAGRAVLPDTTVSPRGDFLYVLSTGKVSPSPTSITRPHCPVPSSSPIAYPHCLFRSPPSSTSITLFHCSPRHPPPSPASITRHHHPPPSPASITSLHHAPPSPASITRLH